MITRDVTVSHPGGVHALVAQELAALANRFASSLYLRHEGRTASAGQPVSILALGVREGAIVTVLADGLDESRAVTELAEYLAGGATTISSNKPLSTENPQ